MQGTLILLGRLAGAGRAPPVGAGEVSRGRACWETGRGIVGLRKGPRVSSGACRLQKCRGEEAWRALDLDPVWDPWPLGPHGSAGSGPLRAAPGRTGGRPRALLCSERQEPRWPERAKLRSPVGGSRPPVQLWAGRRVAGGRGGLVSIPGLTARPPSWAGCPLPAPVTSRGRQQWEMTKRQVPCWCPCPRPPPSAAPQIDRPWHKVGEGEDAAHGPSGSRRYFLIQGNMCSCFSFPSRAGSSPRTGSPALHWAGR